MDAAIAGMKEAYHQFSAGNASMPLRSRIEMKSAKGVALFMPAAIKGGSMDAAGALAIKVVSIFGENPARGLPLIHAVVLALDANSGRPLALIEGGTLTAIRTGAASGADLEGLGEEIRRRVKQETGITLEWEIRRIGRHAHGQTTLAGNPEGGAS